MLKTCESCKRFNIFNMIPNCRRILIFQSACSNQNTYKPTHIRLNMSKRSFHTHQIHQTSVIKTRLMTHGPHVAVLRYKIQQNQCQADRCGPNQQIPWWLTILDLSFGMGFEDMIWLYMVMCYPFMSNLVLCRSAHICKPVLSSLKIDPCLPLSRDASFADE